MGITIMGVMLMNKDELTENIIELERQIALLPVGSITKKKIKGRDYYYHRVNINGKRVEEYVNPENLEELTSEIKKRKKLEKNLKELKKQLPVEKKESKENLKFNTMVITGERLKSRCLVVNNYKKRECIQKIREYIYSEMHDKVFILYGLRRTGKTTMIRQLILELSDDDFMKAAFIQVTSKDTLYDINDDLRILEENGYKYIFIDEVTLMEDFIDGAALFSDIYASCGMKIVLSGTDSLGFGIAKGEQLYDRCIMLHTTFIPYREFEHVLGVCGIDEYIRYGGTMTIGGINYNDSNGPFSSEENVDEYIDESIAKNIQHSLRMYQGGGHFRHLLDLYEKGELTNVINRVVEDINHAFTRSVVESTFKSHDIGITANNLLRDRNNPIDIKKHMNLNEVTDSIKKMLDILNKEEQNIDIDETHMQQIKEYLVLLDIIKVIDLEFLPDVSKNRGITVITQPGLRYAQAKSIVESLLKDPKFVKLNPEERQYILDRMLSEIKGRMMEEIVLLETKIANKNKNVFKLQFSVGEFDMVVQDPETLSCWIYEIKYSKEQINNQYRHLIDEEKCKMTEHRYGRINGRFVIYRGDNSIVDGISYLNVEDYLKGLGNNN